MPSPRCTGRAATSSPMARWRASLRIFLRFRAVGDALLVNLFDVVTFELATVIDQKPEILTLRDKHAYRALKVRLKQRGGIP